MRPTFRGALAGTFLLLLLSGTAHAQEVRKLQSDAPEADLARALDVVIVSDGYAREDEQEFFADARRVSSKTLENPAAAPILAVKKFNWHYAFVSSRERGAPDVPGAPARDTTCKAHLREDEFLQVDDAAAEALAVALAPDVDVVVVLIKFQNGGATVRANADVRLGQHGRVRLPSRSANALVHELGHTLFALGDEYVEFEKTIPDDRKSEIAIYPNLSVYPDGARWRHVTSTVVEGAGTWAKGVYKADEHCCMNETDEPRFCAVCEFIIKNPGARPKDPVVTLATDKKKLTTEDPIAFRWTREPGAPPVRYWVTLAYLPPGTYQYQPVWWGGIEGHLGEKTLGGLPPGRYSIGVRTEGTSGQSNVTWAEFTVEKSASGIVKDPLALMVPSLPTGSPVGSAPFTHVKTPGILGAVDSGAMEEPRTVH